MSFFLLRLRITYVCSNMNGPRDYHTEWSKPDRDREISYDIAYMYNLIFFKCHKWTCLQNRPTDTENKLMVTKEEKGKGLN